jgi:hypothetical protein
VHGSARVLGHAGGTNVDASASGSSTNFGGLLSAGYQAGRWDLRAGLLAHDAQHIDNSSALVASVGCSFAQF